jgi:hypothetical protein
MDEEGRQAGRPAAAVALLDANSPAEQAGREVESDQTNAAANKKNRARLAGPGSPATAHVFSTELPSI